MLAVPKAKAVYSPMLKRKLKSQPMAIILGRIVWSINKKMAKPAENARFFREGRWWMHQTYLGFMEYGGLSNDEVKLALKKLKQRGLIVSAQFDAKKWEQKTYYAVNEKEYETLLESHWGESPLSIGGNPPNPSGGKPPIDGVETPQSSLSKSQTKSLTREPETISPPLKKPKPMKTKKPPKHTIEDLENARGWLVYALREMNWGKPPSSWTEERFAEAIYKVRALTNLNHEGVRKVLSFIEKDTFWVKNALSPESLLKKSRNDVRKIDNILLQMKPQSLRNEQKMAAWKDFTEEELKNPFG